MLDDLSPARKIAYAILGVISAVVLFTAFGSDGGGVTGAPKATRATTTTGVTSTTVPVPKAFERSVMSIKLPNATSRPIEGSEHSFVKGLPELVSDVLSVLR